MADPVLYLEDLQVGQRFDCGQHALDAAQVKTFAREYDPQPFHLDEEAAKAVRLLLKKGVLGSGVFEVDDCRRTYDELKSKGVQFAGPPEERFYGIEAIMKDGQGNWFSMTQHKDH